MYIEPCARVRIGTSSKYVEFLSVNKIVIEESVKELGDKATITLPRNYKQLAGKSLLEYIKVGDEVLIELGVNNQYRQEFKGFLGEIETNAPLVLHVDDLFYPLKRNNWKKAWRTVTLRELLTTIAPGYTIDCPDVNLGQFQLANVSTYRVISELSQTYGFYSFIRNNVLTCQFAYDVRGTGNAYTYTFYETVKANGLKYHRAEDVKVRIKAIANLPTGKKLTVEVGSTDNDASQRTLNFGNISKSELQTSAEQWYKKLCFDGYTGTITGFCNPRTHAGDSLTIVDREEPDREGQYLIEKTVITYDPFSTGFQRENTLSFKI